MKTLAKKLISVLVVILALFLLVWGGLNLAKFVIYGEYYSIESKLCGNPGLNDGFVCQGISALEDEGGDLIIVSGYMADHSASRLYVTDLKDNSYYVSVNKGGKAFTGHMGGVANHAGKIYIASEDAIHVIPTIDVINAKNGEEDENP